MGMRRDRDRMRMVWNGYIMSMSRNRYLMRMIWDSHIVGMVRDRNRVAVLRNRDLVIVVWNRNCMAVLWDRDFMVMIRNAYAVRKMMDVRCFPAADPAHMAVSLKTRVGFLTPSGAVDVPVVYGIPLFPFETHIKNLPADRRISGLPFLSVVRIEALFADGFLLEIQGFQYRLKRRVSAGRDLDPHDVPFIVKKRLEAEIPFMTD